MLQTSMQPPIVFGDVICESCRQPQRARHMGAVRLTIVDTDGLRHQSRLVLCRDCFKQAHHQPLLEGGRITHVTDIITPTDASA
jgi:hypothetical protein